MKILRRKKQFLNFNPNTKLTPTLTFIILKKTFKIYHKINALPFYKNNLAKILVLKYFYQEISYRWDFPLKNDILLPCPLEENFKKYF
jgi:hypothetical protein